MTPSAVSSNSAKSEKEFEAFSAQFITALQSYLRPFQNASMKFTRGTVVRILEELPGPARPLIQANEVQKLALSEKILQTLPAHWDSRTAKDIMSALSGI